MSTLIAEQESLMPPQAEAELDELLSRPSSAVVETMRRVPGDVLVLGASGKMGPTLTRMLRRAKDAAGDSGRVLAAARFSNPAAAAALHSHGIETVAADLMNPQDVRLLPEVPSIIFMAGQKFGTADNPEQAWAMNTVMPAYVADRFAGVRQVIFSTGCVYPNVPAASKGSHETDDLGPVGDYSNSCVGRERVFTFFALKHRSPLSVFRLNYAIDLRYGVLVDIATKVLNGNPVDVTMGYANVIWQGDANARAIMCLEHAACPPFIVNVTGSRTLSIRRLAERFAELFDVEPNIIGEEAPEALLSDASRATNLFGPPSMPEDVMVEWVAAWLMRGGRTLNKPTHFERFDGKY
ncbi:MAG TPA: NAD(P)-dependent oxidoreductase [Armatimonadota bacterium]|jgi:nucleoside-diphosphate-sugar epimerase